MGQPLRFDPNRVIGSFGWRLSALVLFIRFGEQLFFIIFVHFLEYYLEAKNLKKWEKILSKDVTSVNRYAVHLKWKKLLDSMDVNLLLKRLTIIGIPADIVQPGRIWLKRIYFYVSVNWSNSSKNHSGGQSRVHERLFLGFFIEVYFYF